VLSPPFSQGDGLMKQGFLEAGRIINTHGIRGEIKIEPWCDSPDFLRQIDTLYLDGQPFNVLSCRTSKRDVIVGLDGVTDVNGAMCLKGKTVCIRRDDVALPPGRYFIVDLIGLEVRDAADDRVIGTLTEVLTPPAHPVYVVKGDREYLIPAVDAFIAETNPERGYIRVNLIEGMGD